MIFSAGNEQGIFRLHETDGTLTLISTPSQTSYVVVVSAYDAGEPPLKTDVTVTVTVDKGIVDHTHVVHEKFN